MADEGRPEMPLVYLFYVGIAVQGLAILCMLYAILKKYRRIQLELRVQARRLRRKHQEIELKELSQIVRQTKQLAKAQKEVMIEHLRGAEDDANNSNYDHSQQKIEAVRNAMHRHKSDNRNSQGGDARFGEEPDWRS